ncbi:hypothetical protein B0H11DRAFT_229598 [Mycena galericulata]|nr:hypothetical protein B0H11DRAFT_229598 [Mycena galericulata]
MTKIQFFGSDLFRHMPLASNSFLNLIAEQTPGFSAVAVKRLYLVYWVTAAQAVEIFSKCTAVQHLGCFVNEEGCPDLPLAVSRLSLSQLSINLSHFLTLPVTSLTRVTHLDLIFWESARSPDISSLIQSLHHLPQLTHLALAFNPSAENPAHTKAICANLPNLRVVVVIHDDTLVNYTGLELPNVYSCDPRLVVIPRNTEIMIKDWEAVDSKSFDMWAHAESLLGENGN